MPQPIRAGHRSRWSAVALVCLTVGLAGCSGGGSASTPTGTGSQTSPPTTGPNGEGTAGPLQPERSRYSKALVIAMENHTEGQVLGSGQAPYLTGLAARFGRPTQVDAGYPTKCPSLAAYLLITSGSTHGVCDDRNPSAHPISGDNLFAQVAASGREWRNYAESMPSNCYPKNSSDELYAVRHAPAPYYVSERDRCQNWDVPLGSLTSGPLHSALASGALPAFSFVTPNQCNNMHAVPRCPLRAVQNGDAWISRWMPQMLASPDFTSGRLVVFVTWDEGTRQDNHIPVVVLSASTQGIKVDRPYTQCSVLRTIQEILRVSLLGCAAQAESMLKDFELAD
jgi:phosphatidylinositol-3-phosphatase